MMTLPSSHVALCLVPKLRKKITGGDDLGTCIDNELAEVSIIGKHQQVLAALPVDIELNPELFLLQIIRGWHLSIMKNPDLVLLEFEVDPVVGVVVFDVVLTINIDEEAPVLLVKAHILWLGWSN